MEVSSKIKSLNLSGRILVRNTALNFIGQVIPLLVGVVTIPFIIRGLGVERFGLLSLSWIILGYFSIFDLGLGRATTKFIAEALGKGKEEDIPRLLWTSVSVQIILGVFGGFVFALVVPFLVEHILKIPMELAVEAKTIFYLLALAVPVVLTFSSFQGVLEATQRFDLVNAVKIPLNTMVFLIPLIGVILGLKLSGIVALILTMRFLGLLILIVFDLSLFPSLRKFSLSFKLFPYLFSFGGWVTVTSIAVPIFTYLERFLIASFLSVGILTFYVAPYEIVSRMVILPTSISMTLFPAFSYYGANNENITIKRMFSRALKYLVLILTPVFVIFIVFAKEILKFWLGKEFVQSSTVILQVLAISFFLNALAYIPFAIIQGLGRPDLKAKLDIVQLPIFIVLCCLLIPKLGLTGAGLAKLGITVIDTLCLFSMAGRITGFKFKEMLSEEMGKVLTIFSLFTFISLGVKLLPKPLFFDIAIFVCLICVYIFSAFRFVMDNNDRLDILNVIEKFSFKRNKDTI